MTEVVNLELAPLQKKDFNLKIKCKGHQLWYQAQNSLTCLLKTKQPHVSAEDKTASRVC